MVWIYQRSKWLYVVAGKSVSGMNVKMAVYWTTFLYDNVTRNRNQVSKSFIKRGYYHIIAVYNIGNKGYIEKNEVYY